MSVTVAQLVQEGRYVAVPLEMCLDALHSEAGEPLFDIAMIQKILSAIVEDPDSPRIRNLNASKLLPRLTSPSLAGWYVLRHAGFLKRADRLLIPDEHYSPETVASVLASLAAASATAAERRAELAEVQRRDDEEYAQQRAQRAAAQKAKEEERERQAQEAVQKMIAARDAAAAAAAAEKAERDAKAAEKAAAAAAALTPAGEGAPGAPMSDGSAETGAGETATSSSSEGASAASVFDSLSAEDMDKMTPEQLEDLRRRAQEEEDAEMARKLNEELNGPSPSAVGGADAAGKAMHDEDDDEVDPALAAIAAAARKREAVSSGAAAAGGKKGGEDAGQARSTLGMTHEEKMEWLKNKMANIRERRAKEAIETEKAREMSRRDVGKAAQEVQEKLEMMRMKDAAALKRKEDNEKRAALARMKAKVREEKERRKIQAEQRAQELERIRAAKNAQ